MKRMYRSRSDVMIAGVCSGLAKYLEVDPTVIRLVFVLLLFAGFGGLWIYLVLWIVMPQEPTTEEKPIEVMETAEVKEVQQPKKVASENQPAPMKSQPKTAEVKSAPKPKASPTEKADGKAAPKQEKTQSDK